VRVLIAPDSFKGSASATAVAAALAAGWLAARPGDRVTRLPLADGGEGTLDVLAATVPGARWHRARRRRNGGSPGGPVAGQVSDPPGEWPIVTLTGLAGGTGAALASFRRWLREAGRQLARDTTRGMA
jgi:glycerate 2-kinase